MLYLLLLYAVISFFCLLAGILFYEWFLPRKAAAGRPVVFYLVTGLIVLTGVAQWLALLVPLNAVTTASVVSVLLILTIIQRKKVLPQLASIWQSLKKQWAPCIFCLACFVVMIVTINSGPTIMDDTDSYHIQMVKWLQEYGTVPGLANLHLRYGFNSSWFSAIGLLVPPTGSVNLYLALNGLLSCWFVQYLLEKLQLVSSATENKSRINITAGILLVLVASVLTWSMVRGNATNMNYDFITTVCVFTLFLETSLSDKFRFQPEWLLWPCFLFTVRIINFPVLLMALYAFVLVAKSGQVKQIFGYAAAAFFLVVPFLIRNVILSGYLLYPAYQVDIFDVDWKADRQMTVSIVDYIKYYNRVNVMFRPLAETRALSFPEWVAQWFHFLFQSEKPVVVTGLIGFIIGIPFWKTIRRRLNGTAVIFLAIMLVQLVCWFFTAPDPRFVFGPLLAGLFLLPVILPPMAFRGNTLIGAAVIILSCALLVYTGKKIYSYSQYRNFVQPCAIPQPPVNTVMVDGIPIYMPEKINDNWNARCYGTELPCLYRLHPALRARGKEIKDGFYLEHPESYKFEEGAWY